MFKRYTLIALCGLAPALGFAQAKTGAPGIPQKPAKLMDAGDRFYIGEPAQQTERAGGAIWMEDFGGAVNTIDSVFAANGAWGKEGINGQVWRFSTTPTNGCWSTGSSMPLTNSASNGFLLFDADSANCVDASANPPVFNQDALNGSILSPNIDLSGQPAVILSFEYESRWCCSGAGLTTTVEVSGDGGATWPASFELEHNIVNEQYNGVFEANVSGVMGDASEARIRITWDVQSHYYFVVDDIMITAAPSDDIRMISAYVSHNGTGEEYGRVPSNQTGQNMLIGAEVVNFGATDQDSVELDASFAGPTAFAGAASVSVLAADDSTFLEDVSVAGPIDVGSYVGTFTATSEADTSGGANFGNNTLTREFDVNDELYSIDGIDVYPSNELTDLGTNSFTGGEDGFVMMTYYDVTEPIDVWGIEFLLGPNTSADGEVVVSLHDTVEIYADNVLDPLTQSDVHVISQSEVNADRVVVLFDEPYELMDNAFYAAVEMFSDGNTNDIEILDDLTVPQPGYSSMIYIPNDQVYSNGNAAAIRLILEDPIGINETEFSSSVAVTPNPSSGIFTVELNLAGTSDLRTEVIALDGSLVASDVRANSSGYIRNNMDLSHLSEGVYFLKLITDTGIHAERIVITK